MTINKLIDTKLIESYNNQKKRDYLGASALGDECTRRIQYQLFHTPQKINANQVRTFDTGHCLEDLVAAWLRISGFDLKTKNDNGDQFGFSTAEGRIQGHVDGIIYKFPEGLEIINTSIDTLWECKTMNNKNWNETAKYGVFATKFIYFVQVQIYMAYLDLKQCLFTALNKDTSELFLEIVPFDLETAQRYSDRAVNILKACDNQEIFPRLSADKNFFKCKMCSYREECWK